MCERPSLHAPSEVSDLFRALTCVGAVEAVKLQYRASRTAGGDYLVFSPSGRGRLSYHLTVVSADTVDSLRGLGKGGVTTGSLMRDERIESIFGGRDKAATRFGLLMALYVLTARGDSEMTKDGRNVLFRKRGSA